MNEEGVCELSNIIDATKFAYDHYTNPVANTGNSYLDYLYEMIYLLSIMPESIKEQPRDIQCHEAVLRNKLAALVLTRQDLVELYFNKDVLDEEEISAMWRSFEEGLPMPSDPHALRFANYAEGIKQNLCDYINSFRTLYGTRGLLTPKITMKDLELLLTTGNAEKYYTCNNIAKFSFILSLLANKDIRAIDHRSYQNTVCCQGKLLTRERESKPAQPVKPKDLSKSLWQINATDSVVNEDIRKSVYSIVGVQLQQKK